MAYSLVGSAGTVTLGASGGAVTPAWGAGTAQTANNLLVLLVGGWGNGTLPNTPAGWSQANSHANVTLTVGVFYKIAAGSDAAPTVGAVTGMTWGAQLLEFAGNVTSAPHDRHNSVNAGASPFTLANTVTDAAFGELVVWSVVEGSNASTATLASSPNNGMVAVDVQNNSTSTATHYLFGYGVTTSNSAVDTNTVTYDDATDTATGLIASFLVVPGPVQSNLRATMRARRY